MFEPKPLDGVVDVLLICARGSHYETLDQLRIQNASVLSSMVYGHPLSLGEYAGKKPPLKKILDDARSRALALIEVPSPRNLLYGWSVAVDHIREIFAGKLAVYILVEQGSSHTVFLDPTVADSAVNKTQKDEPFDYDALIESIRYKGCNPVELGPNSLVSAVTSIFASVIKGEVEFKAHRNC